MKYPVHLHEGGGGLNDVQKLEDRKQENNNFKIKKCGKMGARDGEDTRITSACVIKCREESTQENGQVQRFRMVAG